MVIRKFTLLIALLITSSVCYSQQVFQSVKQEKCDWNQSSKAYENCLNQNKDYEITLNNQKNTITIKQGNNIYSFEIITAENTPGKTIFQTIQATGVQKTITLTQNKLEIPDFPGSQKTTFFLNHN